MLNGREPIEFAKVGLIKAVNRLGVVRRSGRSGKVGLAPVLMVLTGGRASVKDQAETLGLERELMGVKNLKTRGGWRSCRGWWKVL
jgi:rhamnose utilization protein RhaD (predicted bifunctional aldolase and dehydrogenase)